MASPYSWETTGTELVEKFAAQIRGKVILTTGVSPGGLGGSFVEKIAKAEPKLLILAGRSTSKLETTASKIKEIASSVETRLLQLDLQSFASVRKAADEVNTYSEKIDVVVLNAGIMAVPYKKTEDGFESQLQSNHLSHFLLTNLIMAKVLASSEPRIIVIGSDGNRLGHVRYTDYNFHDGESYSVWRAYGQTKTANNLFAAELAKRLGSKGLVSISLHPGVIATNLSGHIPPEDFGEMNKIDKELGNPHGWRDFRWSDLDTGVASHVYASFAPDAKNINGAYLEGLDQLPFPAEDMPPWAVGEVEQAKCWKLSEKLVGQIFDY